MTDYDSQPRPLGGRSVKLIRYGLESCLDFKLPSIAKYHSSKVPGVSLKCDWVVPKTVRPLGRARSEQTFWNYGSNSGSNQISQLRVKM